MIACLDGEDFNKRTGRKQAVISANKMHSNKNIL